MSNRRDVLALVALTVLAILACACTSKESVTERAQPDGPNDAPHESAPSVPIERDDTVHGETKAREPEERKADARRRSGDAPERPWADNTGPADPGVLTGSGSLTITTDGAVVEDINVTGSVKIDANNVTLRNFKIHNALYAIQIVPGHSGILIEDGEIYDVRTGVYGAGFTARRLYIHDVQTDAMKVSGAGGPTLVEYCFIERIGIEELSHADGNQCVGGSNITFRYNNIWVPLVGPDYPGAPYKANAAFQNQNTISNFVIEYNWLNGGGWTVYCGKNGSRGVSVRYNRFGRGMRFGPIAGTCDQNVGNVWDDTGGPI